MSIERAKLIPMNGNNADLNSAIDVQFNPTTLKVSLANTLKESSQNASSQAAQYVNKSTSSLTVELIFDTTYIEPPSNNQSGAAQGASSSSANTSNQITEGSDVRLQTKKIAEAFIKPIGSGKNMKAPKRCQFRWGAFEFVGLVQSFEETMDFFSPEGRPLRATVSLKLSEDRYQFNTRTTNQAARTPPTLSSTGNQAAGAGAGGNNQNQSPVPGVSGANAGNWRDTSLFNGIETPRMPSLPTIALPQISLSASVGISGGVGVGLGIGGGLSLGGGISAKINLSATLNGPSIGSSASKSGAASTSKSVSSSSSQQAKASAPTPAFKFGNSTRLGTGIAGAFNPNPGASGSLNAGSLMNGSAQLRDLGATATGGSTSASGGEDSGGNTSSSGRVKSGVSVAGLLKNSADSGVGFD